MIAEKIKSYVDEKGIKYVAIANNIGIAKSSMSATFSGDRTLKAEEYVKICDFLEVPYDMFAQGAYEQKQAEEPDPATT